MAISKKGRKLPRGIRQRAENSYEGRITVDGRTYTCHARTVSECKELMEEARRSAKNGSLAGIKKYRFSEWFSEWLHVYKSHECKPSTVQTYQANYNALIKGTMMDRMYIHKIQPSDIQRFYNQLKKDGYSDSTITMCAVILSNCLRYAERDRLIDRNPAPLAKKPKKTEDGHKERVVLTRTQQQAFMEAARDSPMYNCFVVFLHTGMRIGEVRALRREDVDFRNGVIHVRHTVKYINGEWLEGTPKTRTSRRDIPLTDEAKQAIRSELGGGTIVQLGKYIFRSPESDVLTDYCVNDEIQRVRGMADVDIPYFTAHTFRHSFATRCIEAGMKPNTLKTILGHSSLAMTMDLYSHVLPDTKQKEIELLKNVM